VLPLLANSRLSCTFSSGTDAAETINCKLLQHQQLCDGDMMIFRLGKGPPSATNVVLVVVIRFSKIPQGFVNMQPIVHVIKLHVGICDYYVHPSIYRL